MTRLKTLLLAGAMAFGATGCNEFLDVNTNPNGPEKVSPNLYLAPMVHWVTTGPQFDGRFVGQYTQMWTVPGTILNNWTRHGYDQGSDNGGEQWRNAYWHLGQNLVDMMRLAEQEERWDLLGVGYLLKAWGWYATTTLHGEIIVKEAFKPNTFFFEYDSQEFAYQEIERLLGEAIKNLQRTDGAVNQSYLARTDRIYGGDRTRWLKLSYGLLAMVQNHYSNKASYKPLDVIANVDRSLTSNAEDPLLAYTATVNDDRNFYGWTRNNMRSYRQTAFSVNLMNGTQFGGTVDPRLSRMLSPSPDGQYRGYDINVTGSTQFTVASTTPQNFFGYVGTTGGGAARYIFDDKSRIPMILTYATLQFVKAEAAFRAGNRALALQAYTNGVSSHIDFVNARNNDAGQTPSQISSAEKAAFLANPNIVPTAANLTLSHIMSQKFIALWGWGFNEAWMDMRRYNYTDLDPAGDQQVFRGLTLPTQGNLFVDNQGKVVQRIRARFNSEYVWNRTALDKFGGLAADFHTVPLWITQR
jgi:hypothetical protein